MLSSRILDGVKLVVFQQLIFNIKASEVCSDEIICYCKPTEVAIKNDPDNQKNLVQ